MRRSRATFLFYAAAITATLALLSSTRSVLPASPILPSVTILPGATRQMQTFARNDVEYSFELPSATWRAVPRSSGGGSADQQAEFIYGDRSDAYLRVRKEVVEETMTASALARRDQDQKLRFTGGFVEGKEERFAGRLNGVVASYEYTSAKKPMLGRVYYLQADKRTVYVLHFTGARDKLSRIRNQTDVIARSFQLK